MWGVSKNGMPARVFSIAWNAKKYDKQGAL
jgi:hypothetical protein